MTSVRTDPRPARDDAKGTAPVAQVSLPRLYVLRAGYLMVGVGLAVTK